MMMWAHARENIFASRKFSSRAADRSFAEKSRGETGTEEIKIRWVVQ